MQNCNYEESLKILKSNYKKNRQNNERKKEKKQTMANKILQRKLKIAQHEKLQFLFSVTAGTLEP